MLPTHGPSGFSLVDLTRAQNTDTRLQLGKISSGKAGLITECWRSRVIEYPTENGNREALWVQNGWRSISRSPFPRRGGLGAAARCHGTASQDRIVWHVASPGKDPKSKFKVWFLRNTYRFRSIIRWKNVKSNHCKSRPSVVYSSVTNSNRFSINPTFPFLPRLFQWDSKRNNWVWP